MYLSYIVMSVNIWGKNSTFLTEFWGEMVEFLPLFCEAKIMAVIRPQNHHRLGSVHLYY